MKTKLMLLAVATVLSACGGGGGDTTSATSAAAPLPAQAFAVPGDMTKYDGTWSSTCIAEGQAWVRLSLVLQANSTSASGRLVSDGYSQAGCTGPNAQLSVPITVTYMEMAGTAEKIAMTEASGTTTMLATFSQNGRALSINDGAETFTFTKQ